MQSLRTPFELPARHRVRLAVALGAAFAYGCATGVAVTDDELAEICEDPNLSCGDETGGGGSPIGSSGTGGTGFNGGQSGSFNSGGGTGGTGFNGGQSGSFNSGGTSSGTAGTSATAGTGGTGTSQPLAEGDCLDASSVTVLYEDRTEGDGTTNQPSMTLSVQNSGAAFDLTALTMRYWFTADGNSNLTGNVDYASLGGGQSITGQVTLTFGQEFGSDYAEVGFSGGGQVTTGVEQVQIRFHSDPYADMDQTNDFSFLSPATNATPNPNITPYVNGTQVGGCTPIP